MIPSLMILIIIGLNKPIVIISQRARKHIAILVGYSGLGRKKLLVIEGVFPRSFQAEVRITENPKVVRISVE